MPVYKAGDRIGEAVKRGIDKVRVSAEIIVLGIAGHAVFDDV
jgi:hypothetical protein